MVELIPNSEETRHRLNELARHQFIKRMYNEIMFDIKVCEIEGWDKTEFIEKLRSLLDTIGGKQ